MKYFPDKKIEKNLFEKFKDLPTNVKAGLGGCLATAVGLTCIGALVIGGFSNIKKSSSPSPTTTPKPAIVELTESPSPIISSAIPTVSPTLTKTPTPLPTNIPTPIPLEEVPFENPYVTMYLLPSSSFEGNLKIKILAAGSPIRGQGFSIYNAVKDITGMWSAESYNQICCLETDNNGEITSDLPTGNYVIIQTTEYRKAFLSVGWGVPIRAYYQNHGIPFSLVPGRDLEITLNPGVLDVGLLNVNDVALYQKNIYPYCQGKDVTGKPVIDENRCPNPDPTTTDNRGIARLLLGLGPYMICYHDYADLCVTDVTINPGEYKEMRIVIDDTGYRSEQKIKSWWWCDETSC